VPIVLKSGSLNLLEPLGPVQACNGIALPYKVRGKKVTAVSHISSSEVNQIIFSSAYSEGQHVLLYKIGSGRTDGERQNLTLFGLCKGVLTIQRLINICLLMITTARPHMQINSSQCGYCTICCCNCEKPRQTRH